MRIAVTYESILPPIPSRSWCKGKGKTGIPTYMTLCTVCRGSGLDQAEVWRRGQPVPNGNPCG